MKTKTRIIVRPWTPRIVPYTIPAESVRQTLALAYPKFKKVLYIGWVKRRINGKPRLFYLAATADTTRKAREMFKKSEAFGENVWDLAKPEVMEAVLSS